MPCRNEAGVTTRWRPGDKQFWGQLSHDGCEILKNPVILPRVCPGVMLSSLVCSYMLIQIEPALPLRYQAPGNRTGMDPSYLSRIGHVVPVRRWEVHLAHQDLIKEHLLVITTSVETNNKRKQSRVSAHHTPLKCAKYTFPKATENVSMQLFW